MVCANFKNSENLQKLKILQAPTSSVGHYYIFDKCEWIYFHSLRDRLDLHNYGLEVMREVVVEPILDASVPTHLQMTIKCLLDHLCYQEVTNSWGNPDYSKKLNVV